MFVVQKKKNNEPIFTFLVYILTPHPYIHLNYVWTIGNTVNMYEHKMYEPKLYLLSLTPFLGGCNICFSICSLLNVIYDLGFMWLYEHHQKNNFCFAFHFCTKIVLLLFLLILLLSSTNVAAKENIIVLRNLIWVKWCHLWN